MNLLALVNARREISPTQSTTALLAQAARRYGASWVAGIEDASLLPDGSVTFDACAIPGKRAGDPVEVTEWVKDAPIEEVNARDLDALVLRTNPGRDKARAALHEASLNICRLARNSGPIVLNDPDALPKASDKLYLAYLPERLRPRMLVSRSTGRLRAFVEDEARAESVLKPLFGTQGKGVFRVRPGGPNLGALIDVLTNEGFVIAQEYLRRAPEGDTRVLIVDGRPLEVAGRVCAVRRVPSKGEFRSNVHLGGRAIPAELTPPVRRAAAAIGEVLDEHGIWMAGVDLVGTRAVEINVRSPGGLVDASLFEQVDFVAATLDSIARRVAEAKRTRAAMPRLAADPD